MLAGAPAEQCRTHQHRQGEHHHCPRRDPRVGEPVDRLAALLRVVRAVEAEHPVVERPDEPRRADSARRAALEVEGPAAYFTEGIQLTAQHRRGDAIECFRHALELRPSLWQASYMLGVELAGQDKVEQAAGQFAETLRWRPDYARAHLNLGVALAKQRKFEDALKEFRVTLTLNPTNKLAQQSVEKIEGLKKGAL